MNANAKRQHTYEKEQREKRCKAKRRENVKDANYKHSKTKELNYKASSCTKKQWNVKKSLSSNVIIANSKLSVRFYGFAFILATFAFCFHRTYLLQHTKLLLPWIRCGKIFEQQLFVPITFYFSHSLVFVVFFFEYWILNDKTVQVSIYAIWFVTKEQFKIPPFQNANINLLSLRRTRFLSQMHR